MNYSDKLKYIQKYLTNEMSSLEKDVFATWLKESNENKILFDQLGGIWENAAIINTEEFNFEQAYSRHIALLSEESITPEQTKVVSFFNLKSIAAVLIFVLLSTVVFNWVSSGVSHKAVSKSLEVTLEDGTKVWLDKGSELEVMGLEIDSRKVRLSGKAFFEVSTNLNAPFSIKTNGVGVKVLGTKFLVDTKANLVNVKEGKVEVTHKDKAIVLTKNQSVTLMNNHLSPVKESNFDNSQLWFNEDLVFDNVAFDRVISDISKEYQLSIEIPTQNSWAECLFTSGSLKGNTIEQILIILEVTYDIEYLKTDKNTYKFTKVNCK